MRLPALRLRLRWKIMLSVLAVIVVLVLFLCFYVTQPTWGSQQHNPTNRARPERLEAHVRMLTETLGPRDYTHPANLDRVANYLQQELKQTGGRVQEQAYQVEQRAYRNVLAAFGPETNQRIVVGAHYDTAGPYPGADDNASGVAGLLELGHLLGQMDLPLTVELVAYSLEEPPFFRSEYMGSAIHARALQQAGIAVRVMFSLEMIGYFSDEPDSQQFPSPLLKLFYPSRGDYITVVGRIGEGLLVRRIKQAMQSGASLPVYSINAPRSIPGVDFSDHMNYWRAGYPAVMVTNTAFYRNPYYHTAADTAEKLDYQRLALVVDGVCAAVQDLAR